MKFLFGGKMTNTDKHNQTTKNHPPMNLDSLESLSSVTPPNMSKPNYTLPTRAPNRTYQSSDLPTVYFLARGMSRSPLAQEIMRDLLQKSSYFGRIRYPQEVSILPTTIVRLMVVCKLMLLNLVLFFTGQQSLQLFLS